MPGVFWYIFEQLIPSAWFWIAVWLNNQRPQTLLCRRIKPVHAFVQLQLRAKLLHIGSNRGMPGVLDVARQFINGRAHQNRDDRYDQHDFQ